MSNWPIQSGANIMDAMGTVLATSDWTALAANSTINVKGTTYTQLSAATALEYVGLYIFVANNATVAAKVLFDIAIGAASSEQDILANILYTSLDTTVKRKCQLYYFPISIPSGVRLSMRSQSSVASTSIQVAVFGVPSSPLVPYGYPRCTTYGAVTASSAGTQIDSGAVANTKGAYAVLSAATANAMKAFVAVQFHGSTTIPAVITTGALDVSIGAAAAEQPIVSNFPILRGSTVNSDRTVHSVTVPVNIPAATRLTARCQMSGTDAQARLQDIIVYGFD